ncbi:hydroxysteroid 11-beta-dehydrogenase 1-like protein isoform X5 [Mustela lutreola]|uniref:hydroxysteroid 11-beta-dehydrogenase 1-like protein isoform X5 n=1 Tax=Mustela lutreola TaxID=9666 RepID=UPI002797C8FA|nr:hydroxysteroid 11-beta-dehydrogenase 1-like protein isoform X5 [Mustela lutreola]
MEERGQGLEHLHQTRASLGEWGWLWARSLPAVLSPAAEPTHPGWAMKVLLFTGLGALFFSYYWDDNFDPASLQGARVLLTGASAGVGEELAYHYARLGSHLVLTAHTEALLQKVVGNCRKLGAPKVFFIAADMASPEVRPLLGPAHHRQAPPPRAAVCPRGRDSQSPPPPGELPELRAADFVGAAQPDGQQRLSGGRVLAARPCAHILLQPVLGGQVRAGRLLRLSPAGAGRAGRERGHHHVRPGPPGSRLDRRGSQGRLEGQGGPRAQGSPGGDPRWRHPRPGRLLPLALPPALSAAGMAAAPEGLVHPPGAQCLRCRCCLSSRGWPSSFQRGTLHPAAPER